MKFLLLAAISLMTLNVSAQEKVDVSASSSSCAVDAGTQAQLDKLDANLEIEKKKLADWLAGHEAVYQKAISCPENYSKISKDESSSDPCSYIAHANKNIKEMADEVAYANKIKNNSAAWEKQGWSPPHVWIPEYTAYLNKLKADKVKAMDEYKASAEAEIATRRKTYAEDMGYTTNGFAYERNKILAASSGCQPSQPKVESLSDVNAKMDESVEALKEKNKDALEVAAKQEVIAPVLTAEKAQPVVQSSAPVLNKVKASKVYRRPVKALRR